MNQERKIFIAGHRGMVGSAIARQLANQVDVRLLTASRDALDLRDTFAVRKFFEKEQIHEVYLAAAKVGGIHANSTYPADFLLDNLMIQNNVISSAGATGVDKLLFLGSSCIYPKFSAQPIVESDLLSGFLEPTNEPYALAKIVGIKLCESMNRQFGADFRSVMPTNLYGPGDNYHPENSHVIPGLIRRFHEAKTSGASQVSVWGSGNARREFLHVDDMAAASVAIMAMSRVGYRALTSERVSHLNVGSGVEVTIRELAKAIAEVIGYVGEVRFDSTQPEGTPRKLLDSKKLRSTGWAPDIDLSRGLTEAYQDFLRGDGVRK